MVSGGSLQKNVGEDIAVQVPQAEPESLLPFSKQSTVLAITQPEKTSIDTLMGTPATDTLMGTPATDTVTGTTDTVSLLPCFTTGTSTTTTITTLVAPTTTTTTTYEKFLNEEQTAATVNTVRANAMTPNVTGLAAKIWMRSEMAVESATRIKNKTLNKSFGVYSIPAAVRFIADVGQATGLSLRQLMGYPPGNVQATLLEVGVALPPINQVEHDIIRAADHGKTVALRANLSKKEAHIAGLEHAMLQLRALSTKNKISMEELLGYQPVGRSKAVVPKVPSVYECPPVPYGLTTDRVDREARPRACPEGHDSETADDIELDDSTTVNQTSSQESNSIAGKKSDFAVPDDRVDEKISSPSNGAAGEELGEKGKSIGGSKTDDIVVLDDPDPDPEALVVLDDPKPVADESSKSRRHSRTMLPQNP